MMYANGATQAISIHAPRTESDCIRRTKYRKRGISIHAPPHGERLANTANTLSARAFQSTLPARGATSRALVYDASVIHFNPRSPHGERRRTVVASAAMK